MTLLDSISSQIDDSGINFSALVARFGDERFQCTWGSPQFALSTNGALVAMCDGRSVRVFDVDTGLPIESWTPSSFLDASFVVFFADQQLCWTNGGGLYCARLGSRSVTTVETSFDSRIRLLAAHPTNTTRVYVGGQHLSRIIDLTSSEQQLVVELPFWDSKQEQYNSARLAQFSRDGDLLVVASTTALDLWNLRTNTRIFHETTTGDWITSVALSTTDQRSLWVVAMGAWSLTTQPTATSFD